MSIGPSPMGGALGLSHGPGPMGQAHLGGAQLAAPADAAFEDDKDAAETVKSARDVLAGFYKDNDLVLLQKATACENPWHFAYNYVNTVLFWPRNALTWSASRCRAICRGRYAFWVYVSRVGVRPLLGGRFPPRSETNARTAGTSARTRKPMQ